MNKNKYSFFLFVLFFVVSSTVFTQVEMVAPSDKIYDFLDRMLENKIIFTYSSSMAPISRREIAKYLVEILDNKAKLTPTDKKFLNDYMVEYEYDIYHTLKNKSAFFSDLKFADIFSDKKQKYLYTASDSNSSFFWDGMADIRYIGGSGDSLGGKPHVLLAKIGTRIRGTLFNSVGYYLRLSNGARVGGTIDDAFFAARFDPILASTRKFVSEGSHTFDSYEGYLRYAPAADWLGLTIGRESVKMGTGFIDNLIISNNNSAPFDFIKLDLKYKKIKYSFMHSSLVGNDSTGKQLDAKYFVFHRLEIGPLFNNVFKFGFSEMLLYSNVPINFAFLNPISFITSADLNTELPGKNTNNTLIGLDFQLFPVKKLSVQGTLLIDDLNFGTLSDTSIKGNDNKFGYQGGLNWQDAFTVKNMSFTYEYTKIGPFVYSHRDGNNSYTNWNLPIGAALNPNSDEHAVKLSYDFNSRLNIAVTFKHQRTGKNLVDSLGRLTKNVGSNILIGEGDFVTGNKFLNGNRVNTDIIIAEITWQPIRQYYLSLKFQNRAFNFIDEKRKTGDTVIWGSFKVDY